MLMSIWCQFLVNNLFQGECLYVKLTSYLMSNYWFQCFDFKLTSYLISNFWCQFDVDFWSKIFFKVNVLMWNLRHIWCQTIDVIFDVKLLMSYLMSNYWCHIWCQTIDVKLLMSNYWCPTIDVKLLMSYLMSNYWCQCFDVKLL